MFSRSSFVIALALVGSVGAVAADPKTEPVKCAVQAQTEKYGLNQYGAIRLCGGTDNAVKTLECYLEAQTHGWNQNGAISLCSKNRNQF